MNDNTDEINLIELFLIWLLSTDILEIIEYFVAASFCINIGWNKILAFKYASAGDPLEGEPDSLYLFGLWNCWLNEFELFNVVIGVLGLSVNDGGIPFAMLFSWCIWFWLRFSKIGLIKLTILNIVILLKKKSMVNN